MEKFLLLLKELSLAINQISIGFYNRNYNDNTKVLLNTNNSNTNTDINDVNDNGMNTKYDRTNNTIDNDDSNNINIDLNNDNQWRSLTVEDTVMIMLLSLNLCEQLFSQFLFKSSSSSSSSSLSLRQLCVQLSYDIHSIKAYISR